MNIDIDRILLEMEVLPELKYGQICLQGVKGNNDPFLGVSFVKDIIKKGYKETDFTYLLFDMPYTNSIINNLNLCRTRIMNLKYKTCYSYHQDLTKRIHIPLVTNENCWIIIEKEVKHYPADGNWYEIDTTKKHTAVNASWEDRIHLVGNLRK